MGNPAIDPYAQYTKFAVLEFGAPYNDGGICALVQPLIGERIYGTLTPNIDVRQQEINIAVMGCQATKKQTDQASLEMCSHLNEQGPWLVASAFAS